MLKTLKILLISFSIIFTANLQAETTEPPEVIQQAEQGDALSQAKLAAMYLLGREGLAKNPVKAAEWMEKAADQGLLEAQVVMAAMYDRGLGVKQDVKTATGWYEKAAKQGHGASLAILGKNEAPKGSVGFNYKTMRLQASKQIPNEYAKRILRKK